MGTSSGPRVGEVDPDGAWQIIAENSAARLIDVRTSAEWGSVGVPDLKEAGQQPLFVEWAQLPDMSPNPRFAEEVMEALGDNPEGPLLFLCRSGVRSLGAAHAIAAELAERGVEADCLNVAEGFEGDAGPTGQRGTVNGWVFRGLAWRRPL
ncbi:MAG: rhodanese-like domain-containing protein [Pseudomonadota bacterium]